MPELRLQTIWQQLEKLDQEYCASHNPNDFDIEEAKICVLEYFLDNPNAKTAPDLAFNRFLKREKARRLRIAKVNRTGGA